MRLTLKLTAIGFITLCTTISCAEFMEYPLEGKEIALLAPVDSLVTRDTSISFWWSTHEDAKFYRLQLVSPQFDSITLALVDTLVPADRITLSLPKNLQQKQYSWRVRPENNGSAGHYTSRILTIKP